MKTAFGIDIGATGIKGALVDLETGALVSERYKMLTPKPATPDAIADAVSELVHRSGHGGPLGFGFPAIIREGICCSATNISDEWLGLNVASFLSAKTKLPCFVANDADVAGIAELHFGNAQSVSGTVILITLGTGIGSSIIIDGHLLPNTELGHLKWKHGKAEDYASNRARKESDLGWEEWATELSHYLGHVEFLFSPNLILLSGGVSKKMDKYLQYIDIKTPIKPAKLLNSAGLVGAACLTK